MKSSGRRAPRSPPRMAGASKPLEWTPRAREAYLATLEKIASEDPVTAAGVRDRVERTLALLQEQPALGTPAARRGERRFPMPRTGHVINYRVTHRAIRIVLWYRARQRVIR